MPATTGGLLEWAELSVCLSVCLSDCLTVPLLAQLEQIVLPARPARLGSARVAPLAHANPARQLNLFQSFGGQIDPEPN